MIESIKHAFLQGCFTKAVILVLHYCLDGVSREVMMKLSFVISLELFPKFAHFISRIKIA